MVGIPTVLITTDRESSEQQRPPRAIHPVGFRWGHSLGRAESPGLQREVLRTALAQLEELHMPGEVRSLEFAGYGEAAVPDLPELRPIRTGPSASRRS